MLKKELRKAYKIKRQELNDEELAFKSLQIANQLVNMPIWEHVYYRTKRSSDRVYFTSSFRERQRGRPIKKQF